MIIGDGHYVKIRSISNNKIRFVGHISKEEVEKYYEESRAVIVPSYLPKHSLCRVDGLKFGTLPICANVHHSG